MIHLALRRRRYLKSGTEAPAAMTAALTELRKPILIAGLVVGAGFGVFALSSFPPTRHFGIAIVLGTAAAAAWALTVLPYFGASGFGPFAKLPKSR